MPTVGNGVDGSAPTTMATPAPSPASDWGGLTGDDGRTFLFWGLGASALVLIAGYWPRVALSITGLIAAGLVLNFAGKITGWLQSSTPGAVGGSEPSAGPPQRGVKQGLNASGTGSAAYAPAVRFPSAGVRTFVRSGG